MATTAAILLGLYAATAATYWGYAAYAMWRMADLPTLARDRSPEPERWPGLSILVPGCNEGEKMEAAARSLMALDYPDFRIILIDDRSTDETGRIVDRLAGEDERVTGLHVTELPDGWLGKVNALNTGFAAADGELVLLTDADVHYEPNALKRAVAHFVAGDLDHLAAIPGLWPTNWLLDGLIAAFIRQFLMVVRPWKVRDPNSPRFMGVGAFNLIRREAFLEAGGFEWLRMEVADDMAVGMMMKRAGRRCGVINAAGAIQMHWYQGVGQAVRSSERAWSTPGDCSAAGMIGGAVVSTLLEMSPLLGPVVAGLCFALGAAPAVQAAGWAMLAAPLGLAVTAAMMVRWAPPRMLPPIVAPLVAPVSFYATIRSALLGLRRGGIVWRGTLYTNDQLRQGRRVRFF